MLFAQADQVKDVVDQINKNEKLWIYIALAAGGAFVLFVLFKMLTGSRRKPDQQKGLRETLAEYPPPPPLGSRQLEVNGVPGRLRLVVVAPTGKQHDDISANDVARLLDEIHRGLGSLVASDKPRIKVWPPQLSVVGFAPTFHRLVDATEPGKKGARWIKLAGQAKTNKRPILVGMAILADEPANMADLHMDPTDWQDVLQLSR
jgi:hypothetical protein